MKTFKITVSELSKLAHEVQINSIYPEIDITGLTYRASYVFGHYGFGISFLAGSMILLGSSSIDRIKSIIEDEFNMDVIELEIAK